MTSAVRLDAYDLYLHYNLMLTTSALRLGDKEGKRRMWGSKQAWVCWQQQRITRWCQINDVFEKDIYIFFLTKGKKKDVYGQEDWIMPHFRFPFCQRSTLAYLSQRSVLAYLSQRSILLLAYFSQRSVLAYLSQRSILLLAYFSQRSILAYLSQRSILLLAYFSQRSILAYLSQRSILLLTYFNQRSILRI